jgi:hypothetical protein
LGTALLQYQVLFFDADGKLLYTGRMDCEDDEQALERAAHLRHLHSLELWRGERCVRRFEVSPSS